MNIKRFFGKNSRETLNMVRKALGENAVIISNRSVNGGNEIMAVSDSEMHAMATDHAMETAPDSRQEQRFEQVQRSDTREDQEAFNMPTPSPAYEEEADFTEAPTLLSILTQNKRTAKPVAQPAIEAKPAAHVAHEAAAHLRAPVYEPTLKAPTQARMAEAVPTASAPKRTKQESEHAVLNHKISMMMEEMRNMRQHVESQLTAITWNNHLQNNPVKAKILSTLLAANFSASLARQLAEKLPNNLDMGKAHAWIKNVLCRNVTTIDDESELLSQGGVFALVGPTGVGKTTTTAKLAARYVMKHGTKNLGLITTDGYRIGGHEQLRTYGKILGVMVYAVKDETDLKIALNELKNKHTILIDTVGVSQRDQMVAEQIAMLSSTNMPIKKLLCLSATSAGETLTDVIKAYKGRALDGCIITKLDEAASFGCALDVVIREKIKLYYTTHGQRVPEDISLANKDALISRALTLNSASWPYQYLEEELPFVMSNMHSNATNTLITEAN